VADIYLKRTLTGFVPADEASQEVTRKYKVGDVYRAKVVKPRSYLHHKLCMALLNLTFENQDRYDNFDTFRYGVAVDAGHCEDIIAPSGEVFRMPKSISYDALDEVEFTQVMASMMTVCANLLGGMELRELEAQVGIYADNHYGRAA
jgi:hypothetical protein